MIIAIPQHAVEAAQRAVPDPLSMLAEPSVPEARTVTLPRIAWLWLDVLTAAAQRHRLEGEMITADVVLANVLARAHHGLTP